LTVSWQRLRHLREQRAKTNRKNVATMSRTAAFLNHTLSETEFSGFGPKYRGKVRDVYDLGKQFLIVVTDRQSAFDQYFCTIPLKGQVLNQLSAWWFKQISDLGEHHVVSVPDPNVMIVKKLSMIPVEIVVRRYLTGSTSTSAWVNYAKGTRNLCGLALKEGMKRNQRFDEAPIITPTTKGEHDELISPADIVARGILTQEQWQHVAERAQAIFARGEEIAASRGLILVDTKYEMGFDTDGSLVVADEVHTPDSSRYWIRDSYDDRFASGVEPESLDKEFFRLWLKEQGFEYGKPAPLIDDSVRVMLAERYLDLYERVTGEQFVLPEVCDISSRIEQHCQKSLL
jgi:phosphoribosylaminoimidazole-succinocarboxamide synthase